MFCGFLVFFSFSFFLGGGVVFGKGRRGGEVSHFTLFALVCRWVGGEGSGERWTEEGGSGEVISLNWRDRKFHVVNWRDTSTRISQVFLLCQTPSPSPPPPKKKPSAAHQHQSKIYSTSLTKTIFPFSPSEHDSFADVPWTNQLVAYVRQILAQARVKLVGVCFGHQIIGRAMGAKVGRNDNPAGWEVSVTDVDLTAEGRKVFDQGKDVLVSTVIFFVPPPPSSPRSLARNSHTGSPPPFFLK